MQDIKDIKDLKTMNKLLNECWQLYKKAVEAISGDDSYWAWLIDQINSLAEKYGRTKEVNALVLGFADSIDKRWSMIKEQGL